MAEEDNEVFIPMLYGIPVRTYLYWLFKLLTMIISSFLCYKTEENEDI